MNRDTFDELHQLTKPPLNEKRDEIGEGALFQQEQD